MNIKCIDCGLVNWASDIECKRCGSLLTVQDKKAQSLALEFTEPKPFLTSGLQLLLVLLGFVFVAVVISRAFHLLTPDLAIGVSAIAALTGVLLLFVCHIWLLARIFEQSVGWGLGTLFVPFLGFIAIGKFWEHTKRSFVGQLVCAGIVIMAFLIVPDEYKPRKPPVQTEAANNFVLPAK